MVQLKGIKLKPDLIVIPVVMAGILGIYGMIVAVILC